MSKDFGARMRARVEQLRGKVIAEEGHDKWFSGLDTTGKVIEGLRDLEAAIERTVEAGEIVFTFDVSAVTDGWGVGENSEAVHYARQRAKDLDVAFFLERVMEDDSTESYTVTGLCFNASQKFTYAM